MTPATAALQPPSLRLLGGFELLDTQGRPMVLPYDKARALLAMLCLQGAALEREPLAELLWPDSVPAQARANLRRALFDLRRSLARLWPAASLEALQADKTRLQLGDALPWHIDCHQFDLAQQAAAAPTAEARRGALQRAVELYRGPLLAGLSLDDAPGFEAWLAPRREALQRQALQSLNALSTLLEQEGDLAEALACARRSLVLDPWYEPALRCCMRVLAQQQQAAQALALFEQFGARLQQELGLSPQANTMALAQHLRLPPPARPAGPAQRRRIVALACEWDAHPDVEPEALAAQLQALREQARRTLQDLSAYVQRAEGGELLAYFGHPQALEQTPRIALDAALQLLAQARAEPRLQLRLGLHLGWVQALADQAGPDSVGSIARPARRLALLTEAGSAQLSAELAAQGQAHHRLAPQSDGTAMLLGVRPAIERLRVLRPMVGREAELAQLLGQWKAAQQGARVVWLQAEPGLGKTHLLQALRRSPELNNHGEPWLLQLRCLPEFSHTPFQPFVAALQRALAADEAPEAALQTLARQAGLSAPEQLDGLRQLLHTGPIEPASHPLRKSGFEALLTALFEGLGGGRPHLLLIEDLHWADPSTLDLLAHQLLQRPCTQRRSGLIVLSSRLPPPTAWLAGLDLCIELKALDAAAMQQLIAQLEPAPATPAQRQQVLQRAEGVPLFAQELARSLQLAPGEAVPASLWDLLAARLDRLEPALKRLAQAAALLGSGTDLSLLQATLDEPNEALQAGLQGLVQQGLLQPDPIPRWQFRHALIRDAAYESLGDAERRALHRRAADALLASFPARVLDEPELLASHLRACADPAAAHYWLQAGRRAAGQSAHVEARHLLEQGLQALAAPAAPAELVQRLRQALLLQLGNSLLALEGYGSRAAHHCFEQALAAGAADGPAEPRFQALWGLWLGSRSGPGEAPPLQLVEQLRHTAEQAGDPAATVQATYALGNNLFFLGQLAAADHALQAAAEAGERLTPELLTARYGEHGGIAARAMRSWPLALLGRAEAAQAEAALALDQARTLGHAQTLAFTLSMAAVMHRHLRQANAALPVCQELLALAEKHGLALWQAVGALVLGWVQAEGGDPQGLLPIRQAVAASAVAMPSTEPTFLSFLIEALLRLDQHREALALSDEVMAKARERQELYLLPELWRMRAQALRADGAAPEQVQAALAQAQATARAMGAELLWQRSAAQGREHSTLIQRGPLKMLG